MTKLWSRMKPAERFLHKWIELGFDREHIETEYRFDHTRKYRFDFAWPDYMVAVEVQGFGWGHQAQQHIAADAEKLRTAVKRGWRVLIYTSRCLGSHAKVEAAIEETIELLNQYPRPSSSIMNSKSEIA